MPNKTSKKKRVVALPKIPKELIDQMVSGPMDAEAVNAASMAFKKALIERILGAELSHHLEPPRDLRRLIYRREWSHEQIQSIFP
jgi:hypothetical protein